VKEEEKKNQQQRCRKALWNKSIPFFWEKTSDQDFKGDSNVVPKKKIKKGRGKKRGGGGKYNRLAGGERNRQRGIKG